MLIIYLGYLGSRRVAAGVGHQAGVLHIRPGKLHITYTERQRDTQSETKETHTQKGKETHIQRQRHTVRDRHARRQHRPCRCISDARYAT